VTGLADLAWPLRTDRLLIRPSRSDDADAMWTYWQLPDVYRWTGSGELARDQFTERMADPGRLARTLSVELDGRLVGDLMVKIGDAWAQPAVADRAKAVEAELGWVLDPAYGGRGLATEAVLAAMALCFEGLGLRRVVADCFAANAPSVRLMERVGLRLEASTVADALHASGEWLDGRSYALLATEWRQRAG
jgi:RimJ/RimL family protein N-acetyltransferase